MSDKSATEILRDMLDERGVEYDTRDGKAIKNTYWNDGHGRRWGYTEDVTDSGITSPTLFLVSGQLTFTPEQAIAATLGHGTCHNINTDKVTFRCSECEATDIDLTHPNYCRGCGRKVVDE